MKLIANIVYHTVWGESLRMRSCGNCFPMKYAPGDVWIAEVDGLEPGSVFEYRYELLRDGVCVRAEWKSHRFAVPPAGMPAELCPEEQEVLSSGDGYVQVQDVWSDVPVDLPLESAPFKSGIFSVLPGKVWKAAGTAVPVFSLRSGKGFGIGEFSDLKLLAEWAARTGQKILQLLPVNDTKMTDSWFDSYPYNANSTYALHPQFVNLEAAGLEPDAEYENLRDELNALPQVDYERVNKAKIAYLRRLYDKNWKNVAETDEYFLFFQENAHWLKPYAVFCCLRDEFGTADFHQWKEWSEASEQKIKEYSESHSAEVSFWYFVQYHLDRQLSDACRYAHSLGVVLKGDLPIGVSRTSADAWLYPDLFHLDSCAGAPPDAFSSDGQNWGFPTYDWEAMSRDGYAWWKSRLTKMSEYFDAFRIDHILGFFRIWEIPLGVPGGMLGHFQPALPYAEAELAAAGFDMSDSRVALRDVLAGDSDVLFIEDTRKPGFFHPRIAAQNTQVYSGLSEEMKSRYDTIYEDFFYRRHNAFWKASALGKLPDLLSSTGMLACGEDLGMIPASVPEVMSQLKILSLEIQRMPKAFGKTFDDPASYPYMSVCTTSTHDMSPLRAWWNEDRALAQRFWTEVLGGDGEAPLDCNPEICRRIVLQHLESPSMLAILPVQDWLSTDWGLRYHGAPEDERINVPADSRHYWRYRMHVSLEELLAADEFNEGLRTMIALSGR